MGKVIKGLSCILIILFMCSCLTKKSEDIPDIMISFTVSNLSDEEYSSISTYELSTPQKEDFKNIEFLLGLSNLQNMKVEIPNFRMISNEGGVSRYWCGDNMEYPYNENNGLYTDKFVLYSNDLDDQGIKDVFRNAKVKVSWTDNNEIKNKIYNLGDIMTFK